MTLRQMDGWDAAWIKTTAREIIGKHSMYTMKEAIAIATEIFTVKHGRKPWPRENHRSNADNKR